MPNDLAGFTLDTIQKHFLTHMFDPVLTIGFLDDAHFNAMVLFPTAKVSYNSPHCKVLARFYKVDQLSVGAGMERGKCSQEIDCLKQTGLALGIITHQHDRSTRQIDIQPGEIPEISKGKMGKLHFLSHSHKCHGRVSPWHSKCA